MNRVQPIELFIAALIKLLKASCWVINELRGHHQSQPKSSTTSGTTPQPSAALHVGVGKIMYTKSATTCVHRSHAGLSDLTIKQLQAAAGVSPNRHRKADLIQLALHQKENGGLVLA